MGKACLLLHEARARAGELDGVLLLGAVIVLTYPGESSRLQCAELVDDGRRIRAVIACGRAGVGRRVG